MFEFVSYGAEKLQLFLLVILRLSGLFILAPVFGDRVIPPLFKAGLAILFGAILTLTLSESALPPVASLSELAALAAREILIGFMIGFFFMLLFYGVQSAGTLIGYQVGFAIANVVDPSSETEQPVIAQFWFILSTLIFLCINGHHLVVGAFVDSYKAMPVGQAALGASGGELLFAYTSYVFVIALKLSAPVLVTLFLTDITLAIVSKMMPTMNVFIVGFAIKAGVGLAVMALSLPVFNYVLEKGAAYLNEELAVLLIALGKA